MFRETNLQVTGNVEKLVSRRNECCHSRENSLSMQGKIKHSNVRRWWHSIVIDGSS